jgi:hypothetical protein
METKKKTVKKSNTDMYDQDLTWMSYRYAIGLKPEKEDDYFNVDFNSPEYHALAAEFREFLKKKKIKNVSDLLIKDKKDDLVYLSYHYALGRKTYAALHAGEIASHVYGKMSVERSIFMAHDIRKEIYTRLNWAHFNFGGEYWIEDKYCPIEMFMQFMRQNNINNIKQLRGYTHIEPVIEDGNLKFITEWSSEEAEKNSYIFASDIEDYFCWADLASCLDYNSHKWCKIKYDGKEEYVQYFDSWVRDYGNNIYYETIRDELMILLKERNIAEKDMTIANSADIIKEIERKHGVEDYGEQEFQQYYGDCEDMARFASKIWRKYLDTVHPENFMYYKKIKRGIKQYIANSYICSYINEDYIVEDNIEMEADD